MTAKEFMKQHERIVEKIRQVEIQIYDIEQTLGIKGVNYDSQPHGSEISQVTESTATKLIELREVQRDLVDKLWTKRIEIERVIFMIENATLAELLQRKYIRLQKWDDIATDMKFDSRYIYKLHGKALVEADKIIRKRKRT
ncbi:MAG: hypothetical protein HXL84_05100 [[Eubacterium] sulci]|jgi:hypothetical protein|nr:hypothetical protein [[Eubacterium] sulci]DAP35180.1 MAG TPA: Protein of unknown function (DUF1492) [Caudoviricetes sp.]DAR66338.1 MAG TPA: Protein of unknown function (DUF1492) [Caudoviricetes sp.]